IPPCGFAVVGLLCFLLMFNPSTKATMRSRSTSRTRPFLERSTPERTWTISPFLMCVFFCITFTFSEHLWCKGDDLHELFLAQFLGHGAEDAGAFHFTGCVEQYHGVVIETDVAAVLATGLLLRAYHNRLVYSSFLSA